ncbi:MAG: bifunctional 4-hydroxy-2-oxoglutarate aldolase/2-dehydro-3-deoxy-phosphogluconate aldolase [Sphingomonadaceae bacterium]|nr:bifunctional 4-hydroxy-2-oxoglutarate aldolase/2-dehydro-3-deoxy-phosphogluconate aldolase [Sphingomonadaceae bacterium]
MTPHELLIRAHTLPVLVIHEVEHAVPLARALAGGGLTVLEVTLRTPAALGAIAAIARDVPEAIVGAGTVLSPDDLKAAHDAGALFGVSPGLTPRLAAAARVWRRPFYPGCATASEAMAAREHGFTALKFFPAEASGGAAALQALSQPLADLRFCPTGGITRSNAASYRSVSSVLAVGGSWMAPDEAVRAGDWERVRALAAEASRR